MNIKCLTFDTDSESISEGLRFKRMVVKNSPYIQERFSLSPLVFTDDAPSYIETYCKHSKENLKYDMEYEYFVPTIEMRKRFQRVLELCQNLNAVEVVQNLEDISSFVYYGYINSKSVFSIFTELRVEFEKEANEGLNAMIMDILKGIRKDFLKLPIQYKGKPIVVDNTAIARLSLLVSSEEETPETISFRFDDGSFVDLGIEEIKRMKTMAFKYIQNLMTTEGILSNELTSLSYVEKEDLLFNNRLKIKEKFDIKLKELS